jgi:hypothetical protein
MGKRWSFVGLEGIDETWVGRTVPLIVHEAIRPIEYRVELTLTEIMVEPEHQNIAFLGTFVHHTTTRSVFGLLMADNHHGALAETALTKLKHFTDPRH